MSSKVDSRQSGSPHPALMGFSGRVGGLFRLLRGGHRGAGPLAPTPVNWGAANPCAANAHRHGVPSGCASTA